MPKCFIVNIYGILHNENNILVMRPIIYQFVLKMYVLFAFKLSKSTMSMSSNFPCSNIENVTTAIEQ